MVYIVELYHCLIWWCVYITICRCVYEPCVITTSCLDHSAKRIVKQQAWMLGGHVVSEWSSVCNLVVMTSLSVTVKVSDLLSSISNPSDSPVGLFMVTVSGQKLVTKL